MGHVGKDSRKRIVMTKRREDKRGALRALLHHRFYLVW